eukprot:COSAG02_NODE_1992_length_10163_cov_93.953200_6_plen_179_part_00
MADSFNSLSAQRLAPQAEQPDERPRSFPWRVNLQLKCRVQPVRPYKLSKRDAKLRRCGSKRARVGCAKTLLGLHYAAFCARGKARQLQYTPFYTQYLAVCRSQRFTNLGHMPHFHKHDFRSSVDMYVRHSYRMQQVTPRALKDRLLQRRSQRDPEIRLRPPCWRRVGHVLIVSVIACC